MSAKITLKCDECGKSFEKYQSQKKGVNSFCCRTCKGVWHAKHITGKNHPLSKVQTVTCTLCGLQFERTKSTAKTENLFCGMPCYRQWRAGKHFGKIAPNIMVTCLGCGIQFEKKSYYASKVKNRHYCSWDCYIQNGSKLIILECHECGKQLERYVPQPGKRVFCNRQCHWAWRSKNESGKNHPLYKSITLPCTYCGSQVERSPKHLETYKRPFCNSSCYGKWISANKTGKDAFHWKGGKIQVPCEQCGKILERITYDIKTTERFFCNTECRGAWQSKTFVGETHPLWKGGWKNYYGPSWIEQRAKARERDGGKCQVCSVTKKKVKKELHVHHIQPFRTFNYIPGENENHVQANALSNLITLCPVCHKKAETGKIALQPPLF